MKNYLNKSTFKGVKSELTVKYGVSKSDDYASLNTNDAKTKSRDYLIATDDPGWPAADTEKGRISFAE